MCKYCLNLYPLQLSTRSWHGAQSRCKPTVCPKVCRMPLASQHSVIPGMMHRLVLVPRVSMLCIPFGRGAPISNALSIFLTLQWKLLSKHWGFDQIDGTNRCSAKIYIILIFGILFLEYYSSTKMLYADRSLFNASKIFFYGILCKRYIQKLTKWSQKHNFH